MSEIREINDITLIDFEGIENITKFKYRTTIPKYPKPGTFYWIEQSIKGQPKLGIYYVANDCELMRLDSRIYDLVIRDKDGYIRITDKDEFDVQEIYLIIGNFEKEDEIIDDGTPNGARVFRITKEENKGLATVEATVEYVSDSNNMLYMSNAEDYWWVGVRLGDIRKGKTKEDLKNNTISEILDTIIYPTLQPEVEEEPYVKLDEGILNGFVDEDDIEDGHVLIRIDKLLSDKKSDDEEVEEEDEENETEQNITVEDVLNRFLTNDILREYVTYSRGRLTYPTDEIDDEGNQYTLDWYAGKPKMDKDGNVEINLIDETPRSVEELSRNVDSRYVFGVYLNFTNGPMPRDNKRGLARYDDMIDTCDCEDGCEKCYIPNFISKKIESNKIIVDVVYPIYINYINDKNKSIRYVVEYPLVNYHLDEGGVAFFEVASEIDGFNKTNPCKLCIDIPNQFDFEIYQYNELCHDYDIKVDMTWLYTESKWNTMYARYIRTKN